MLAHATDEKRTRQHLALPGPAETEAIAVEEVRHAAHRLADPAARNLASFFREPKVVRRVTPKRDPTTTIIDQGARKTYAFDEQHVARLFELLNRCRRSRAVTHVSERQGRPDAPLSGLMLDYDFQVASRDSALNSRIFKRVAKEIGYVMWQNLNLPTSLRELHVFTIVKPEPVPIAGTSHFKHGFHVLVPGVWLARGVKKYIMRELAGSKIVHRTLQDMGITSDPSEALDMNSASVPVLFAGSCKRGGTPYVLGPACLVDIDPRSSDACSGDSQYETNAVDINLAECEAKYNMVAELSLCYVAKYENHAPLVAKHDVEPRPGIAPRIADAEARTSGSVSPDELLLAEHSLSTLAVHDPEARYLHQLLDLLDPSYASDRTKWRNVIFALANTSEAYRPLAEWFSHKCPAKWAEGGAEALDQLWDDAVAGRNAVDAPLTKRSIIRWAKECNPDLFRQVSERSFFNLAAKYVYEFGGMLEHFMVANILAAMLSTKFVVDVADGHLGGSTYCWYEFVVPGQAARPGEVWKWRKEVEPDVLHNYLSEHLPNVFAQITEHIEENRGEAEDEDQARYLTKLGAKLQGSIRRLYNDSFKSGVIRQARYIFRRRGFAATLDQNPDILGVGNGILTLGPRCELIDHFHEHPVSMFTPVPFRRFDPNDPWTRRMLDALADIIPEPDFRDWFLFFAASSLRGGVKEGILLMWYGGGANGKTFVMRMIAKVLGGNYAKKLNIALLTSEREAADRPNSAVMQLKGCRWGYVEETQKAEVLKTQRLKEIVNPGEVSSRELNRAQETFEITANIAVGHNFPFIVNTRDNGTWRRLRFYNSKTTFCANPDPKNSSEKKDDQRFVREYVNDPECQAAFLGILVHYHERFMREHGGLLKNVPCPTLDRETEAYRNSQDTINRFITEMIVVSPNAEGVLDLTLVAEAFVGWYQLNITGSQRQLSPADALQELEGSALLKYIRTHARRRVVVGCRLLTPDTRNLMVGEKYLGARPVRHADVEDAEAGDDEDGDNLLPHPQDDDGLRRPAAPTSLNWWESPLSPPPTMARARNEWADNWVSVADAKGARRVAAAESATDEPTRGRVANVATEGALELLDAMLEEPPTLTPADMFSQLGM